MAREKGRVWGHVAAVATQWAPRSICTYIIRRAPRVCTTQEGSLWGGETIGGAAAAAKYNQTNVQYYYIYTYQIPITKVYTSIKRVLVTEPTCLNSVFGLQPYVV